jgi:cell division protein FtsI (penicillin-binding protein 3)
MRDTLTQAVDSGTGQNARIEGLPISGKTGIVQKLTPNMREYTSDKIETSFIGGFEHSGTPSLIIVWFDDPQREGLENPAAIAFRKIALMMTGGNGR